MKVKWLGHSCFLLTSGKDFKVVTDPFRPESYLTYAPVTVAADVVTVSHGHWDHCYADGIPGNPLVLKGNVEKMLQEVEFRGFHAFHDGNQGRERGDNTLFRIVMEGVTVCHLGDLGHIISAGDAVAIGNVDILLVPVGGVFTITPEEADRVVDEIKPRIVIPMHYKTPQCQFVEFTVDVFIKGKKSVRKLEVDEVEFNAGALPEAQEIVALKYSG